MSSIASSYIGERGGREGGGGGGGEGGGGRERERGREGEGEREGESERESERERVLNPALCIKCKPWGLVLKKSPSWQVGCFSRPCQDSFALFNEDWAVYDSEVTVAIIALSCAWVLSAQ